MKHYCGIYGIVGSSTKLNLIDGLGLLQHRGHEGCGISFTDNNNITTHKDTGLIKDVFHNFEFPPTNISMGIGHVRYSTRKKTNSIIMKQELQPLSNNTNTFVLAHNGNIHKINQLVEKYDIKTNTESDTEILLKYIEKMYKRYNNWRDTLVNVVNLIPGAYCLLILTNNAIYAIKDRYGIRPLCLGKLKKNNWCVSSESVALQNFELMREVEPGEVIKITKNSLKTIYKANNSNLTYCSFEFIYFMNHKSKYYNRKVEDIRYDLGYNMGKNDIMKENFLVIPVPNSSIPSAKGFADALNISFEELILKRKNVNRTFILATEKERKIACDKKFMYIEDKLKDKNIFLIDDSIVRGTTMKTVVNKLKSIGVKSIHLRITSPVIISECYYGIDMSTKKELISHNKNIEDIKNDIGVDSLKYMSIQDIKDVFKINTCTSCFDGVYNKKILDW